MERTTARAGHCRGRGAPAWATNPIHIESWWTSNPTVNPSVPQRPADPLALAIANESATNRNTSRKLRNKENLNPIIHSDWIEDERFIRRTINEYTEAFRLEYIEHLYRLSGGVRPISTTTAGLEEQPPITESTNGNDGRGQKAVRKQA
uniref:Putative reverse transcriptase-rnase h-integrase n=1 Tax=Moniliophthora roreri TaxID=221103 RepID=A0A0W0FXD5_MONRR